MFGWEVIERQQHLAILGQAVGGVRVLGLVRIQEQSKGFVRVLSRVRLPDVVQLGFGGRRLGSLSRTLAVLGTVQRCSRVAG